MTAAFVVEMDIDFDLEDAVVVVDVILFRNLFFVVVILPLRGDRGDIRGDDEEDPRGDDGGENEDAVVAVC